jgi:hypothetical protein
MACIVVMFSQPPLHPSANESAGAGLQGRQIHVLQPEVARADRPGHRGKAFTRCDSLFLNPFAVGAVRCPSRTPFSAQPLRTSIACRRRKSTWYETNGTCCKPRNFAIFEFCVARVLVCSSPHVVLLCRQLKVASVISVGLGKHQGHTLCFDMNVLEVTSFHPVDGARLNAVRCVARSLLMPC